MASSGSRPDGSWHRYYYCRNHDALKAGGEHRRCPERNIRSEVLDAFVFDQVRAALVRPDVLHAGESALALRAPAPDDELLAAELGRLDRKLEAADAERRRLVDLYQTGLLELPELQRRVGEVDHRRRALAQRRDRLGAQRHDLARDNQLRRRIEGFSERVFAVIDHLDFDQKRTLLRLVVEQVRVTGWRVEIHLRIPLDDAVSGSGPDDAPSLSTEDRLRSLGSDQRRVRPSVPGRQREGGEAPDLTGMRVPWPSAFTSVGHRRAVLVTATVQILVTVDKGVGQPTRSRT